jgi:hypothetical protein
MSDGEGIIGAVYLRAIHAANRNHQTVGEKNDLYVTIEQLEAILQEIAKERRARPADV